MIKIYNSLTKKLDEFKPIKENEVSMYVCGPTVYGDVHIGNTRPVIFFDVVARFFKYLGYKVTFVSNFTDIDDKIINIAVKENVSEREVSERNIKNVLEINKRLNCLPHDFNPKVTENIPEIIDFIQKLIDKGDAYVMDGNVFFDVGKDDKYGILSGQTIDNLMAGARIETNENKKQAFDFALWKKTSVGITWPSPWGEGRPGWHTECVVMINNILGQKIDIHGGGIDVKFPHHENEIAQSYCENGTLLANYWMHNGRIDLHGEKMSKSLGNVVFAKDMLEKIPYQVYRLFTLNVPYRQPLNYREDTVTQATNDFEKIKRSYVGLYRKIELNGSFIDCDITLPELVSIKEDFIKHLSDDFNIPNAITSIFQIVKSANSHVRETYDNETLNQVLKLFKEMLWVLGLDIHVTMLSFEDKEIVQKWQEARKNKDFAAADNYRTLISQRKIEL